MYTFRGCEFKSPEAYLGLTFVSEGPRIHHLLLLLLIMKSAGSSEEDDRAGPYTGLLSGPHALGLLFGSNFRPKNSN